MSFWSNKPLQLNSSLKNDNSYILDIDNLLLSIDKEISNSKTCLDYHVITSPNNLLKSELLEFINNNYKAIDSSFTLNYSLSLFNYYITQNTLCILFYPHKKKPETITTQNMIGFICGRPQIIYVKDECSFKQHQTIDVNYLCLIKQLRNLHVSSYIINILTKAFVIFLALSSKLPEQPTQNKTSGVCPCAIISAIVGTTKFSDILFMV